MSAEAETYKLFRILPGAYAPYAPRLDTPLYRKSNNAAILLLVKLISPYANLGLSCTATTSNIIIAHHNCDYGLVAKNRIMTVNTIDFITLKLRNV